MMRLLKTAFFSIFLALMACASDDSSNAPTIQLGYVDVEPMPSATSNINEIREQALHETATTLGAQGGLAWRSQQINNALTKEAVYLDHVFNFQSLLIHHNVLPTILVENDGQLNLDNDDTVRVSDKTYKIVSPARFVTTAPTWRDYLWMNFKRPDQPDITLLPKTPEEVQVWNFYLRKGWKEGLKQADAIFSANLSQLKRDYLGMVLYRKLLSQHMVTPPFIAKSNYGVTGNSQEIDIGDSVMRITKHSELRPNSNEWKPVITISNQGDAEDNTNADS